MEKFLAWETSLGNPSRIKLSLCRKVLSNNLYTTASTTKFPFSRSFLIFFPKTVFFRTSFLNKFPTEYVVILYCLAKITACVPFPVPGGPIRLSLTHFFFFIQQKFPYLPHQSVARIFAFFQQ